MKLLCLVALSLSTTAIAQSLTFTALAPIPLAATVGTQTQTAAVPAGPMTPIGFAGAQLPGSVGTLEWWSRSSDTGMNAGLGQRCAGFQAGTSSSAGPLDVQIDLVAPVATPVRLELVRFAAIPAGVAAPLLRVDVGNNGTFELTESSYYSGGPSVTLDLQLGPTPLPVRVLMDMALNVAGDMISVLYLIVMPRNGITVTPVLNGCDDTEYYWVQPTFAGFLNAYAESYSATPPLMLAVFGLGVQPLLLGTTSAPCLLFPSPDLVVLVAPSTPLTIPGPAVPVLSLPIPPGVGPLTLWTQAVLVEPVGLTTTGALRVDIQ